MRTEFFDDGTVEIRPASSEYGVLLTNEEAETLCYELMMKFGIVPVVRGQST